MGYSHLRIDTCRIQLAGLRRASLTGRDDCTGVGCRAVVAFFVVVFAVMPILRAVLPCDGARVPFSEKGDDQIASIHIGAIVFRWPIRSQKRFVSARTLFGE